MALPPTIPELLEDIRSVLPRSAGIRQQASAPTDPQSRLAHAVWERADGFARAALHNAAPDPPFIDVLGQIARSLWEGMVTVEYVRQRPDVRVQQVLVGALKTSAAIASSAWGKERGAPGLGPEEAAFVDEARRRERAYRDERDRAKAGGENVPAFDPDRCADLPSIEQMAKAVGAHDQYEVVYRIESARATHWGLHAFYDLAGPRLLRTLSTIAGCYRVVLADCAAWLGMDTKDMLAPWTPPDQPA